MGNQVIRYEYDAEPEKCPECGSLRIAKILYGLPLLSEETKRELHEGRITLGGCCITDDDPLWQCLGCNTVFYLKGKERAGS